MVVAMVVEKRVHTFSSSLVVTISHSCICVARSGRITCRPNPSVSPPPLSLAGDLSQPE